MYARPSPRSGRAQHPCTTRERQLRCAVGGAVDDDDLADDARLAQTLVTPVEELSDRDLFVESRHHDRHERVGDVSVGHEERHVGVDRVSERERHGRAVSRAPSTESSSASDASVPISKKRLAASNAASSPRVANLDRTSARSAGGPAGIDATTPRLRTDRP